MCFLRVAHEMRHWAQLSDPAAQGRSWPRPDSVVLALLITLPLRKKIKQQKYRPGVVTSKSAWLGDGVCRLACLFSLPRSPFSPCSACPHLCHCPGQLLAHWQLTARGCGRVFKACRSDKGFGRKRPPHRVEAGHRVARSTACGERLPGFKNRCPLQAVW